MDKNKTSIIVAVIGAVALIIVAIITFWKDWTISQLPISATQTAEARLTQIALSALTLSVTPSTSTATFMPKPTDTARPTVTLTPKPTDTPRPTAVPTLGIGSSKISPMDGVVMMFVPAGEFTRGSNDYDDEKPPHTVFLDAFWIDKYEVTNALYQKCVDARECSAPSLKTSYTRDAYYGNAQYGNYPVTFVSWDDANKFCAWAGKRLPTEAEWEKAARGTDGRVYPWGSTFDKNLLNSSEGGKGDTTAVGSYPGGASPYGALDMAGNVWEWVADWYSGNYYSGSPRNNPPGPSSGQYRVLRGGSWFSGAASVRVASRSYYRYSPDLRVDYWGFRCAQ